MSSTEFSWFPMPRRDRRKPSADGGGDPGDPSGADGQRPPTAEEIGRAVVDCGVYEGGERRGGKLDLGAALKKAEACKDGWIWIGLQEPTPEVVEAVGAHFSLPPLAVEDAVHAHQRPKIEVYGELLFMVLKTARYVDHEELVEIGEIMMFVGARFVVTVRHGAGSPLSDVRKDVEAHPDLLEMGPSAVLYAVADRVVDDYAEVIEGVQEDIEEVEAEVFSGANANPAERIYKLKRETLEFRRAVAPLVAPMQKLTDQQSELPIDARTRDYFRDVLDHLIRDADRIQSFDELLSNVLQANLAQLTVRDNQDLRKLSAWVAIIAVPTMIFGLYGMNFRHMPELDSRFGYPVVLVVILVICAALYTRLKRGGWL